MPVKDLSLPVPGLTLGGDGLIVGFEHGKFFALGQVTLQYGNVAHGELTAAATKDGFSAAGWIELTIPGIEKATGKIWIGPDGTLSGSLEVSAEKSLPQFGVRSPHRIRLVLRLAQQACVISKVSRTSFRRI